MSLRTPSRSGQRSGSGLSASLRLAWVVAVVGLFSLAVVVAIPAAGTTARVIYVDGAKGSDFRTAEAAQNSATPLRSLEEAGDWLLSGDRVVIAAGTYALTLSDREFAAPVVVEGPPEAALALDLEGVTQFQISGFTFDDAMFIHDSSEILVKDGKSSGGVHIDGSTMVTLQDMEIHNVDDPELAPWEKAVSITDSTFVTVRNSWFHNNPEDSIQISEGTDIQVIGNSFENNGPDNATVQLDRDRHSDVMQVLAGTRILFSGNRAVGNAHVLMIKADFGPITEITIENSLFEGNGGYAIQLHGVSDVVIRANSYQCNGVYFRDTCESDAQFDLRTVDVNQVVREDDPVASGVEVPVTTTTLGSPVTTLGSPVATTTTVVATETTRRQETPTTDDVTAVSPIDSVTAAGLSRWAVWVVIGAAGGLIGLLFALSRRGAENQPGG
jgi:hypothetical protein